MPENDDVQGQVDPHAVFEPAVFPEAVVPEAADPEAVVPEAADPEAADPEAVLPEAVLPEAVVPEATEQRKCRRARVVGAAPTRRSQRLVDREHTLAALVLEQEEAARAPATTAGSGPRGGTLPTPNRQAAPAKRAPRKRRAAQATRSQPAEDDEPLWKSAKRPDDPTPADGLRRSKRKAAADATQKAFYCVKAKWAVWTR
jgi:hypothetical protein